MHYGAKIKDLIDDRDIKQKALAKYLNMSESTLSNYVTGRNEIPLAVLVQIADYFHVTTDYLLGRTEEQAEPFPVSQGERAMLTDFRALSREQKELIVQNLRLMRSQNERRQHGDGG